MISNQVNSSNEHTSRLPLSLDGYQPYPAFLNSDAFTPFYKTPSQNQQPQNNILRFETRQSDFPFSYQ